MVLSVKVDVRIKLILLGACPKGAGGQGHNVDPVSCQAAGWKWQLTKVKPMILKIRMEEGA